MRTVRTCIVIALPLVALSAGSRAQSPKAEGRGGVCSLDSQPVLPDVRLTSVTQETIPAPHCKVAGISKAYVGLARSEAGIAYRSVDGQPVKVLILMLLPEDNPDEQLLIKKRIVEFLRRPNTTRFILSAASKKAIRADSQ